MHVHQAMRYNQARALRPVLTCAARRGIAMDVDAVDDDGLPDIRGMHEFNARATAVLLQHGANVHRYWQPTCRCESCRMRIACPGEIAVGAALPQHLQLLLQHPTAATETPTALT